MPAAKIEGISALIDHELLVCIIADDLTSVPDNDHRAIAA